LFVVNRHFFYVGFTKLIRDSPTLLWFRYFDYRFYSWPPPQYMSRLRMTPGFGPFGGKKNADQISFGNSQQLMRSRKYLSIG
jgi:hypothetical protein